MNFYSLSNFFIFLYSDIRRIYFNNFLVKILDVDYFDIKNFSIFNIFWIASIQRE